MKLMIRAHDLSARGEDDIVKRLDELSLDGIQLVAYKSISGITYDKGSLSVERAEKIGRAIKSSGKSIALIGAYFNPVHPNAEKAQKGIEMFSDYLSLTSHLECMVVGSETGSYMGDPWGYHEDNRTQEARDRVTEIFRQLADVAATYSANVGIEGAFNHVCYSPDVLYEVIRGIDRENVRVIFDLYNYLDISNYHDAYSILDRGHELFGKDILLYHLKDFKVGDGKLVQCAVGDGILDYEKILTAIYRVNPGAVLVFEGTGENDIARSVAYVRALIDKISK
jgi:sugar phosphate isomerase/epimerase